MRTDRQAATIFAAIAAQPEVFGAKPELLHKTSRDIVLAQLKDKGFGLERLRGLASALGRECTLSILEELPNSTLSALIGKIDKANKGRADEGNFAITHSLALAFGEVEPLPPPAKPAKAEKTKKKPEREVVRLLHQSKALGRKA
jgi:hypothetical protein